MNSKVRNALIEICREFQDIFLEPDDPLSFTPEIKTKLRLTQSHILDRYPSAEVEVQNQIQNMLEKNIIKTSNRPWFSAIWFVLKKTDASVNRNCG